MKDIFMQYENSNSKILKEIVSRGWAFCEAEKQKDVLFVGINPSYPKGSKPECFSYKSKQAVEEYPRHYKIFETMANSLERTWTYMDLFCFRETVQNRINDLIAEEEGLKFICEQLQLSFEIMNYVSPKVIVVCNKRIHDFFGKNKKDNKNVWMGFDFAKTERENVEVITGFESDFIPNTQLNLRRTKTVFSRHLSRTKKEVKEKLQKDIEYAYNLN